MARSVNGSEPSASRPRSTKASARTIRALALFLPAAFLAAAPPQQAAGQPAALPASPACNGPAQSTPKQTEGPYYKPNSPRRHSLVSEGTPGERILLTGYVLTRSCRPVAGAVLDLWQADAHGAYDNAGYALRGHELTDTQGRFWFETVVPAPYPGRTPHIHVKIQAPGRPVLTTQLYLPNEPQNAKDGIFNPALLLRIERATDSQTERPLLVGRYDFVLDVP